MLNIKKIWYSAHVNPTVIAKFFNKINFYRIPKMCLSVTHSIEITQNNYRKEKCKKKLKLQILTQIMAACISIVTRKNMCFLR